MRDLPIVMVAVLEALMIVILFFALIFKPQTVIHPNVVRTITKTRYVNANEYYTVRQNGFLDCIKFATSNTKETKDIDNIVEKCNIATINW